MKSFYFIILTLILLILYHFWHHDYVFYLPQFLPQKKHEQLKSILAKQRDYKLNWNNLYMKEIYDKEVIDLFYGSDSLFSLSKMIGKNIDPLWKVPIEHRYYTKSKGMKWHKDTLLSDPPQYELVYTVTNTSDSHTEYIDHWGLKHRIWTEPNSIMMVRAHGYIHHVTPVNKGNRSILKIAYIPKK
jgi:hypothetical protein